MSRLLLFVVCFTLSSGLVIWLIGGIRPPVEKKSKASGLVQSTGAGRDLLAVQNPDARGVYIGQFEDVNVKILREVVGPDDTVRYIPKAILEYETLNPQSEVAFTVTGLRGSFFDDDGLLIGKVRSRRALLRLDMKTQRVSKIELEGDVRFEEIQADEAMASLETEALDIRFDPTPDSKPQPILVTDSLVEVRKDGLVLRGTGFEGKTEFRNFRLERDVILEIEAGAGLSMPDMMATGDEAASGRVRIESNDALVLTGDNPSPGDDPSGGNPSGGGPGDEGKPGNTGESGSTAADSETSGWGVRSAHIHFVGETSLTQGAQQLDTGELELHLSAAPTTGAGGEAAAGGDSTAAADGSSTENTTTDGRAPSMRAERLDARGGVVFRDGAIDFSAESLRWSDSEGTALTLEGSPRVTLAQAESNPLFPESTGSLGVFCDDRIVVEGGEQPGTRVVRCFGNVRIGDGVDPDAARSSLRAENVRLVMGETPAGESELVELIARDGVRIRDANFDLRGERFDLEQGDDGSIELVMSENPRLVLAGDSLSGFQMDLLPGGDDQPGVGSGDKPGSKNGTGKAGDSGGRDRGKDRSGKGNGGRAIDDKAGKAGPTSVIATAGRLIRVTRRTAQTTLVDFKGGFTMTRYVGDEVDGVLTSDSMFLAMREDASGKPQISSWNAAGNVDYQSPDGSFEGDHLSYKHGDDENAPAETATGRRVILTGTPGGNRAILRFPGDDPDEPTTLLAMRFVYNPNEDDFQARENVEGTFTTGAIDWSGLDPERLKRNRDGGPSGSGSGGGGGDADDSGRTDAGKASKTDPADASAGTDRWHLVCDSSRIRMKRDPATSATDIDYFHARGRVTLESENQRVKADAIQYEGARLDVIGTEDEPAEIASRNADVPTEWSAVVSRTFLIDTETEEVTCPEGGTLNFFLEDLIDRDSKEAGLRLPTRIECEGKMWFAQGREAQFHDKVRFVQEVAGGRPRQLTCDYFRAILGERERDGSREDTGEAETNAMHVRKAICDGNVKLDHPEVTARGDHLELSVRETLIRLVGYNAPAELRRSGSGRLRSKWLTHNYSTGKTELDRFEIIGTPDRN